MKFINKKILAVMVRTLIVFLSVSLVSGDLYEFSDKYIEKINEEAQTWTAGRNFPPDVTREYLSSFLLGDTILNASHIERPLQRKLSDPEWPLDEGFAAPAEFDARTEWPKCNIGVVPDMGTCASPQIYAAVSTFTDRRCVKSNGQQTEPLSTEYVAACCKRCRYDQKKSCTAGGVFSTWKFLHYRGSVTGGHYAVQSGCQPSSIPPCSHYGTAPSLPGCENNPPPQLKCHTRCTNENYARGFFHDKHKTTIPYWVHDKEPAIMKEIMTHGPTTATFDLYDDFFHYKSGVYQHTKSAKYQNCLHSGKLIGWGVENGTPYWLVMNTWGVNWGDRGTVKILRGQFECGIEYLIAAAKPKY